MDSIYTFYINEMFMSLYVSDRAVFSLGEYPRNIPQYSTAYRRAHSDPSAPVQPVLPAELRT